MTLDITLSTVCAPSDHVVARQIDGSIIIVPLTADAGGAEGTLYTLNSTGQAIWVRLDGQHTLREIAVSLTAKFHVHLPELEADLLGFVDELTRRRILVLK